MVPPSYVERSKCARTKHHMDDDFDKDLKDLEKQLDGWNHTLELGHAIFTLLNTILLVYLIAKLV